MKSILCRILFAVAAAAGLASRAEAVVVVAEDFFYDQPTKAISNLAGFTVQSYGGGQSGSGAWDARWTSIGGTTIVGADVAAPPLSLNPHTAVVTEFATQASLQRPYSVTGAAASASTIYFAADFKVQNAATPSIFAEYGILGPAATPSLSLGITDSLMTVPGTFFAKIGDMTLTGDVGANANDAIVSDTYARIVGKLEINALPATGDFDRNGVTDGNDFLLWQRQVGTPVPPNTGADANGDGAVNGVDLDAWRGAYGQTGAERLTVYFNPSGPETTTATVLTGTADLISSINDPALDRVVALNGFADVVDSDRAHYIDNLAIGTTWADVAAVNVPRLTLEVNTSSGQVRLLNNSTQALDLAYYEILSASDSLNATGWTSLDDQNTTGGTWTENSPDAGQLIESNFTSATTIAASGSLSLGAAFEVGGTQDLVARLGTKLGASGLLNVANVTYVASVAAIPEPASLCLAALGVPLLRRRRAQRLRNARSC